MMCGKMESEDKNKGDKSQSSGVFTYRLHGNCSQPSLPDGANQAPEKQIGVILRTRSGFNFGFRCHRASSPQTSVPAPGSSGDC